MHITAQILNTIHVGDQSGAFETDALGNLVQPDTVPSMAELHPRLAIVTIVEHRDGEVFGRLHGNRRQRPHCHQHLTVTGHDQHGFVRTRHRQAEADQCRAAHRPPEVIIPVVVTRSEHVVG